jgi:hypothetical protein
MELVELEDTAEASANNLGSMFQQIPFFGGKIGDYLVVIYFLLFKKWLS